MRARGQGATEYLVILAVVLIIALIIVAVMGGIPGVNGYKDVTPRSESGYEFDNDYLDELNSDVIALHNECKKGGHDNIIFSNVFMSYNWSTEDYVLNCVSLDLSDHNFIKKYSGG